MEVTKTNFIDEIKSAEPELEDLIISDIASFKEVSKSLSSDTRLKIIELLLEGPLDISRIAKRLNQTEANISAQIQNLTKSNIVSAEFVPGIMELGKSVQKQKNYYEHRILAKTLFFFFFFIFSSKKQKF